MTKIEIKNMFRGDIDYIFSGIDSVFSQLYTSHIIEELIVAIIYKKVFENLKDKVEEDYALSMKDVERFKKEIIELADYFIEYKQNVRPEVRQGVDILIVELHKTFVGLAEALKSAISASAKER